MRCGSALKPASQERRVTPTMWAWRRRYFSTSPMSSDRIGRSRRSNPARNTLACEWLRAACTSAGTRARGRCPSSSSIRTVARAERCSAASTSAAARSKRCRSTTMVSCSPGTTERAPSTMRCAADASEKSTLARRYDEDLRADGIESPRRAEGSVMRGAPPSRRSSSVTARIAGWLAVFEKGESVRPTRAESDRSTSTPVGAGGSLRASWVRASFRSEGGALAGRGLSLSILRKAGTVGRRDASLGIRGLSLVRARSDPRAESLGASEGALGSAVRRSSGERSEGAASSEVSSGGGGVSRARRISGTVALRSAGERPLSGRSERPSFPSCEVTPILPVSRDSNTNVVRTR